MHTDDVFIIQITGNLMQIMVLMNSERSEVLLSNGTLAKNIFRQVVGLVVVAQVCTLRASFWSRPTFCSRRFPP